MSTQELKYKAVYNWVLDNINSGALKVGEKLPSENELSERFGLSRQTVRHAVDILEQQKLVLRVRGSGTYVGGSGKTERQERYMNIAVISTYVDSYIFPPVVRGIERVLSRKGYTTQIAFTGNRVSREQDILNNLIDKDIIDGLIVEPAKSALPNPNLHYYQELKERGIPILFFNSRYPDLELPCVSMNDEQVGKKAVEWPQEHRRRVQKRRRTGAFEVQGVPVRHAGGGNQGKGCQCGMAGHGRLPGPGPVVGLSVPQAGKLYGSGVLQR